MLYILIDVQKPLQVSHLGAFVFGQALCAIIPHSANLCQVDNLKLLTLNRVNSHNLHARSNRRKKAHLTEIKWAFVFVWPVNAA